jgi:hypothetical protein
MSLVLLLAWELSAPKDVTVHDAVPVVATLRNAGEAWIDPPRGEFRVVFTPEGKPERRVTLSSEVVRDRSDSAGPVEPGAVAVSLSFDLRKAVGKLAAGKYEVAVEREGGPRSEPVCVEVVEATLEEAKQAATRTPGLEFTVKEGVGLLANRRRRAIRFRAYATGEKFPEILSAPVQWERWHPRLGWIRSSVGYCGTGLREYVLEPGQSCKLELAPADSGIVRFVLLCREEQDPLAALSTPVLVP